MNLSRYEKHEQLGEGSYGVVYRATDKETGQVVALKILKLDNLDEDGVPSTLLREISILKSIRHINIISLLGVNTSSVPVFLAYDYMETDLGRLLHQRKRPLKPQAIRSYAFQLIAGVQYLHSHRIIHRDIKPDNILIAKNGILKLADFGMARYFTVPNRPYTRGVVTLWYKAPELLLGGLYEFSIDLWSIGCILYEMVTSAPLFPGNGQLDQLLKILKVLGTPTEDSFPLLRARLQENMDIELPQFNGCDIASMMAGADPNLIDLTLKMLNYDPQKRISAKDALKHPYFDEVPDEVRRVCICE